MGATGGAAVSIDDAMAREIVGLLFELVGRMRANFQEQATKLDLSPGQAGAIIHLDEPAPMHRLAEHLGCDASNITGIIDRLEARGLVERRVDEADRRVKNLVLTRQGTRLRARLGQRLLETSPITASTSKAEQRALRDMLLRMLGAE
jgi:DNA-binding MarR family transcriptional regulator